MRLGTDIIEIDRVYGATQRQAGFARRILSEGEYTLYEALLGQRKMEFLAGRFAAKEAYAKALGTGIGRLRFDHIEIMPNPKGAPEIVKGPIVEGGLVSISHCNTYATATVIFDLSDQEVEAQLEAFFENQ